MMRLVRSLAALSLLVLSLWTAPTQAQELMGLGLEADIPEDGAPLDVSVGIEISQISFVDQKSENYGAVVTIRASWTDPKLAYDRDEDSRKARIVKPDEFLDYASKRDTIPPGFIISNQQSNRWIHHAVIAITPDGEASYFESSSLTLQAPHFDFHKYPFDTQTFFFEIVSVFPNDVVTYSGDEAFSGLGDMLGEEEWVLNNPRLEVSTTTGISGQESDRVTLVFEGHRHTQYYMIRIFLPLLVLITVSWAAFFFDDYKKRAEIAGANLLVFVAFNWAVSADLPRLGYLTFVDFILQWVFVVTGAIIVFNMVLARMQLKGQGELAETLDYYVIRWVYPLGYAAIVGFAVVRYLLT
ncbi:hypothetical protein [Cribrihabitans marinus]|nr:hypothetical protein [Cribrihabitans marinus]